MKFMWKFLKKIEISGNCHYCVITSFKNFISYDDSGRSNPEDDHYISDQNLPRNNLDPKLINNSGKHLLNLCKESGLRILNGRTIGDLQGKHTCITYNGCSVIDYMLVSIELLDLVCYFEVNEFTSLSNHCAISCSLLMGFTSQNVTQCQLGQGVLPMWKHKEVEKGNFTMQNVHLGH